MRWWNLVRDDRRPGRVGEVVRELQQQEHDREADDQLRRSQRGPVGGIGQICETEQDGDVENRANDQERTATAQLEAGIVAQRAGERVHEEGDEDAGRRDQREVQSLVARGELGGDDDGQENVEDGKPVEVVGEPEDVDGELLADGRAFGRRGDASGSGGGLHACSPLKP